MENNINKGDMFTPTSMVRDIQYMGLPIDRALILRMEQAGAIGTPENNAEIGAGRRPVYSNAAFFEILTYMLLANIYKPTVGLESRVPGKLKLVGFARKKALGYEDTDVYKNSAEADLVADYAHFLPDDTENKKLCLAYFFARQIVLRHISAHLASNMSTLYAVLKEDLRTSNYFYDQHRVLVTPKDNEDFTDKVQDLFPLFQVGTRFLHDLSTLLPKERDEAFAWLFLARIADVDTGNFFIANYARRALLRLRLDLEGVSSYTLRLLAEIVLFNAQKDKKKKQ